MAFVTRFAPSPTGPLHLGHAYSALLAHDMARAAGGRFLLRIEDIDQTRCRPAWETQVFEDLHWLGLEWPEPVMRQSNRLAAYGMALDQLWRLGLLYPCTCTRRDIEAAMTAPQEGGPPMIGPDGLVYPGTCRTAVQGPREGGVLRLNMAAALNRIADLNFIETGPRHAGRIELAAKDYLERIGDFVIARRDMGTSYHLSVVLDDAAQGVTHVVRGEDLFDATAIHVVLQRLLGLATPTYHHHALVRDSHGKRLAKRDDARALSKFRTDGVTPAGIRAMVGL
jgi:glutamyl-Q tRNA(Asp) synthetase